MANRLGLTMPQHTSGIYSDMTVDGPEIGTLVVVVDRAKNLPNRRTVGKQDPYCAARLGKEAKKTETDLRGGQTPRWDQELRFTVHDSPDYHAIKVSVFNDDKMTEMIGETWVPLWDVVIMDGGGRSDAWHALSYRGKYAGEVRLEMTYYDSRTPQKPATPLGMRKGSQVKRRPLPTGPAATVIPQFGPRALGAARGTTVYLDKEGRVTEGPWQPDTFSEQPVYNTMQPDFLPQIPPRQSTRTSLPYAEEAMPASAPPVLEHPYARQPLAYSQSMPNFNAPTSSHYQESSYGDYDTQQYPDHRSEWDHRSVAPSHYDPQEAIDDDQFGMPELPPLPSSHNGTPLHHRHHSFDQRTLSSRPPRRESLEKSYPASPASVGYGGEYGTPAKPPQHHNTTPLRTTHSHPVSASNSPLSHSPTSTLPPIPHPPLNRQSISDPYMTTPPRAHPLSHEIPRSRSPQPYQGRDGYEEPSSYHFPEDLPVARPQAVTQTPRARHSIAAIRHPITTFVNNNRASLPPESLASSPSTRTPPIRKAVGSGATGSPAPFSPDSFNAYNPTARASQLDSQPSPHNPYHIPAEPTRPGSSQRPGSSSSHIVGFDGRKIDPSDHLPVDSWAPEPESKTPVRNYGTPGRSMGPREGSSPVSGPRRSNIVVNVRSRADMSSPPAASPQTSPTRSWRGSYQASSPVLREIEHNTSPGGGWGGRPPVKPPKIPLDDGALSREISKIDLGGRDRRIRAAVGVRYS